MSLYDSVEFITHDYSSMIYIFRMIYISNVFQIAAGNKDSI